MRIELGTDGTKLIVLGLGWLWDIVGCRVVRQGPGAPPALRVTAVNVVSPRAGVEMTGTGGGMAEMAEAREEVGSEPGEQAAPGQRAAIATEFLLVCDGPFTELRRATQQVRADNLVVAPRRTWAPVRGFARGRTVRAMSAGERPGRNPAHALKGVPDPGVSGPFG